jgi:microcystin-dependent protein
MGSYFRDYYSPKASERPTVGDTKFSVVNMDHMGWLNCDGRSLSVGTYNILFQAIGYKFGGSGNTFNLPDMRGRVPGGIGTGTGLTARTLGATTGTETHTLTVAEMPTHSHTITDPGHTHTYVNQQNDQTVSALPGETAADQEDISQTTGSSTTGISINNTGGSNAHNNMQPTLFIGNMFIYSGKQSFTAGSYPYTSAYPAAVGDILL